MTPKQEQRQNLVKSAAEKLKVAKKAARIRARQEAKEFFNTKYSEYKMLALREYYSTFTSSVADLKEKELEDILSRGVSGDDDDEELHTDDLN